MAKIKICGLSRPQDIDAVNKYLPDYIGFVFAGGSKRRVGEDTAGILKSKLNSNIRTVGVFVNEASERIIRLCKSNIIDIVQLHGDEEEEYIQSLRIHIESPVIKAVRVRSTEDILNADDLPCDYLLFDTYREKEYGGSGMTFDWSLMKEIRKPYFLAGGIQSGNVIQAVKQCHPFCIDVSSGVETDGVKDPSKIKDIITKVRSIKA